MNIEIGARVRTRDRADVGEVHRVVVDLDREAVASIVVLKGRLLSRDILVPLEYVEWADGDRVALRLSEDELEQLPDFAYNEVLSPPPTWAFAMPYPGGAVYVPIRQRERLGGNQVDLTPGTKVWATDGEIGTVDQVEIDPDSGQVDAFWVTPGGLFAQDFRIPAEWVVALEENGIRVSAARADLTASLGRESTERLRA